jgi:chromosome transmission fidelity protein 8
VTLKKPLLVLRKKKVNAVCGDQEPPAATELELEVIGIIRHKILCSIHLT